MAKIGDIQQYRLDNFSSKNGNSSFQLNFNQGTQLSIRIGLSTKEKQYFKIYDNNFAQGKEIIMTITYLDNTITTVQLGKSFMYESQVAMKIKKISFNGNNFPPGTYLEVRYE